jgi:hypothetical protein
MGSTRTAWHVLLAALLEQCGSRSFEYRSEVPLSSEPLRGDFLLLRRGVPGPDPSAHTLRHLWDLLPKDTILEFKSVGRPYRSRNLFRLFCYLCLYYADQAERLAEPVDLSGVLLVPARTPSLYVDAIELGLRWRDLGDGYARLEGAAFALYVVEIDVAADAEDDDLLRLFGHEKPHTTEARRWLARQIGSEKANMTMEEEEEFDEILTKLLTKLGSKRWLKCIAPEERLEGLAPEERLAGLAPEERLAGLAPEQRLAGLAPEERVAGLAPEQVLLSLPVETLQALSDAYIDTLSEPTRTAIRARIGR